MLRDDDTNALTPPECLERLYRPFLARGFPVNLAVIPEVRTTVRLPDGRPEGFLVTRPKKAPELLPIGSHPPLVRYLQSERQYRVVQHGCHHDYLEFDTLSRAESGRRLDHGARRLEEAGFGRPRTFVAPYDRFSRGAYLSASRRFPVISTGWFERRRLPRRWWPRYLWTRLRGAPHWKAGGTFLLSHPGCLLSCHRPYESMLEKVRQAIDQSSLLVLVTHWWEYFREEGREDSEFVRVLHQVSHELASRKDVEVVAFDDVPELSTGGVARGAA